VQVLKDRRCQQAPGRAGVEFTVIAVIAVIPWRKGLVFSEKVEFLPMTASMTVA
jgi:hypothetical protein